MSLGPGARLGPYEVVAAIGAGGMGEVYRARDTRLDRTVAIKILPAAVAGDPTFRERFDREARAVAALNHPHICPLYDIGEDSGTAFLVMEHLEGETLTERLNKGPLPIDQALKYAIQIAEALDKAHRAGIVHRDLKPGNIMLTKSGAKLLDFGLAKASAPTGLSSLSILPTAHSPVTAQGTILGTLQYMAPEQVEGREADARSDIFAFGAIVYEMVTGKRAFEGKSQASVVAAILDREPPAMSRLQPLAPARLDHVVHRCLAKDPDERWQTARDLSLELRWTEPPENSGAIEPPKRTSGGSTWVRLAWVLLWLTMIGAAHDLGFFADGKLKRVSIVGGAPRVLADAATARGGTWNQEGVIVFGQASPGALMRVSASGGTPSPATHLGARQNNHRWPQFLPDGKQILFFVQSPEPQVRGIYVASLDGGQPVRVAESETAGVYAAPGYLLRVLQGTLLAQRFDIATRMLSSEPKVVAQGVGTDDGLYRSAFTVSTVGVIAHRSAAASKRQLVWVDRSGETLATIGGADDGSIAGPELAPDGSRVAVTRTIQGNSDVWLLDLRRNVETRFTFDPAIEDNPVWSPDGTRLTFRSLRDGAPAAFEKRVDGSASEEPLVKGQVYVVPHDWSPDGRVLLYSTLDADTQSDIWAVGAADDSKPIPIFHSKFDDVQEQFSPDGRWIAYASNESGRYEVYVIPFPAGAGEWQVSTAGGMYPRWRRDGKELYYIDPDDRLAAVSIQPVTNTRAFDASVPRPLFLTKLAAGANTFTAGVNSRAQYAVAADGRFLMNTQVDETEVSPVTIVFNWAVALTK